MAELILKVGDSENPKGSMDGDIVSAYSDLDVSLDWLQNNICSPTKIGFNSSGFRSTTDVLYDFHSNIRQYRFEKTSDTEYKKTDQLTNSVSLISKGTHAYSYFETFVKNRLLFKNHLIFGSSDRPIWFGGRTDIVDYKIANIWSLVESKTGLLRSDYSILNIGNQTLTSFFCIKLTADIDVPTKQDLQSSLINSELEPEISMIYKHKNRLSWQDIDVITPVTIGQINNYYTVVDGRMKTEIDYTAYLEEKK